MADPVTTLQSFLADSITRAAHAEGMVGALEGNKLSKVRTERVAGVSCPCVLIAVSGGADSMALLGAAQELSQTNALKLYAAHFIHHPKSLEALNRADLVRKYCGDQIPIRVEAVNSAEQKRGSPEEILRRWRYEFLDRAAQEYECDWIWTGHQADDQVETILLRIFTGTGLRGLLGIPQRRGRYGRPFLTLHKSVLIEFCQRRKIPFAEDPANLDLANPRNRIRHYFLPQLEATINPKTGEAISRLSRWAEEALEVIHVEVERCWKDCLLCANIPAGGFSKAKIVLDIRAILPYFVMIQKYTLQKAINLAAGYPLDLSAQRLNDLVLFLRNSSTGSRLEFPGGVRLVRHQQRLIISAGESLQGPWAVIPGTEAILPELGLKVTWQQNPTTPYHAGAGITADFRLTESSSPLRLRTARPGDRFFPLGAPGTKSLYRFLTDRKVSRSDKPDTLVLECQGEILWVVGQRISESVKVQGPSEQNWRLSLITTTG